MTALIVIGSILLFFALIGCIPIGVNAGYLQGVAFAKLRVAFLRFTMYPEREKKQEKKQKKAERKKSTVTEKKKTSFIKDMNFQLSDISVLFGIFSKTLARVRSGLTVHLLYLDVLCGGTDAVQIAKLYGTVCAVMSGTLPGLYKLLRIKKKRVTARFDFSAPNTVVQAEVRLTIRFGTAVIILVKLFAAFLRFYLSKKKETGTINLNTKEKLKEAV